MAFECESKFCDYQVKALVSLCFLLWWIIILIKSYSILILFLKELYTNIFQEAKIFSSI